MLLRYEIADGVVVSFSIKTLALKNRSPSLQLSCSTSSRIAAGQALPSKNGKGKSRLRVRINSKTKIPVLTTHGVNIYITHIFTPRVKPVSNYSPKGYASSKICPSINITNKLPSVFSINLLTEELPSL